MLLLVTLYKLYRQISRQIFRHNIATQLINKILEMRHKDGESSVARQVLTKAQMIMALLEKEMQPLSCT